MRNRTCYLLLFVLLLTNCRGTRITTQLAIVHHGRTTQPQTTLLANNSSDISPTSTLLAATPHYEIIANPTVDEPLLSAQQHKTSVELGISRRLPGTEKPASYLLTIPDTSKAYLQNEATPREIRDANRRNIALHILGALLVTVGIISIIEGATGTGLATVGLYYGLVIAGIGTVLLLFKSKHSTKYQLREKQRAARRAARGKI